MVNRKQSSFRVRCSSAEKQLFQSNAKLRELSLSEYVRRALRMASGREDAERFYQQQQQLSLRMRTKLKLVQTLTADSNDPQVQTVIAQLLELARELRQ